MCWPGDHRGHLGRIGDGYGHVLRPLPCTTGRGYDQKRPSERNEVGDLRLRAHFGPRPSGIASVDEGPPRHGKVRHAADLIHRHHLTRGQRVIRRDDRDLPLGEQLLRIYAGEVVDWSVHERNVGAAVSQLDGLLPHLAEDDIDIRGLGIRRDRIQEPLERVVRGSRFRGEHDRTPWMPSALRTPRGGSDSVKRGFGFAMKHCTGVRKGDCASIAIEQTNAETRLQLLDRARQRRLRHPQQLGGTAEVQFFRNGDEIFQFAGLKIDHALTLPP